MSTIKKFFATILTATCMFALTGCNTVTNSRTVMETESVSVAEAEVPEVETTLEPVNLNEIDMLWESPEMEIPEGYVEVSGYLIPAWEIPQEVLDIADSYNGTSTILDSRYITEETLLERKGTLLIEEEIGICIDSSGNGIQLNSSTGDQYYIHYNADTIKSGDIVVSYLVYNPGTTYTDDIIERYDVIITSEYRD